MRLAIIFSAILVVTLLTGCSAGGSPEVRKNEKSSRINVELGVTYMRQGKNKVAMDRLMKAVLQDPENAIAYSSLGLLNVHLKQFAEAESNFKKAIDLAPDNSSIRNNYGAFLCKQKRLDEAQKQFLHAIKNPLYQYPEHAYLNAGRCSLNNVQAEKYFRAALRKSPKFAPALLNMAKLSLELKRYLSARGYLQRFHAVQKTVPASLWISVQVEKVLGDNNLMQSHALLLIRKYPDSDETRQYLQWKNK